MKIFRRVVVNKSTKFLKLDLRLNPSIMDIAWSFSLSHSILILEF